MAPVPAYTIGRMLSVLEHRGPDGAGMHIDGALGFGHRRLSILDLSERGRQPMLTPDERFAITYNGEIYNYLELRKAHFSSEALTSETDTEIILNLLARRGLASLSEFNGMFALAFWDAEEKTLSLVRDRLGIKPIYYALTDAGIVFASEVKAILATEIVRPEVEPKRVDQFMTFGYIPGENTLFKGIKKVLPGTWLRVGSNGIEQQTYWDINFEPDLDRSEAATCAELLDLLADSAQLRLRSDVPVGVFLSGGLDSSTTVALLAESGAANLKTFSVGYKCDDECDETDYARIVARRFGTDHHELFLDPDDFIGMIPKFIWHMDEPVAESAAISLYYISKLLREHVVVALSGEGADELFAGYDIYRYMQLLEKYRAIPNSLRANLLDPLMLKHGSTKVKKYVRLSRKCLEERYVGVSLHETWYKDFLYNPDFRATINGNGSRPLSSYYQRTAGLDALSRMQHVDLKSWLVDDLLIKADKMTMANSVELRVPFLDHRVVEFAATIPATMKMRGRTVKWILKKAMQDKLPQEILQRKKVGFPTPLALMFRKDMTGYLNNLLLSKAAYIHDYFDRSAVERLIGEHGQKTADHHKVLWQLLVLEEWHRAFIGESQKVSSASVKATVLQDG